MLLYSLERSKNFLSLKIGERSQASGQPQTHFLLSNRVKIFEKLLLIRLKISIRPKIRPEQQGFSLHNSTTSQLANVLGDITNNTNQQHKSVAISMDIRKAFTKVWHEGLLFKLLAIEVPHQMVKIIRFFLTFRKFQVKIGNSTSSLRQIGAGVPQGSCLLLHLFAVPVNDMPNQKDSKITLFADDTLLV